RAHLTSGECAGNAAGERQFVQWVNPIRRVVEFPIRVPVTLLKRVPRAHAQLNRNDVCLMIRKVIVGAGEMRRFPVGGEDRAGNIVAAAHCLELCGVGLQDRAEAGMPASDRKSTRLNSSHLGISYAVFCLKKKNYSV